MLSAQFPEPYTLCLQCLLQLQDPHLQATEPTQHSALPVSPGTFPEISLKREPGSWGHEGAHLRLHLLFLQLDEGQAGEIHGVCGQEEGGS